MVNGLKVLNYWYIKEIIKINSNKIYVFIKLPRHSEYHLTIEDYKYLAKKEMLKQYEKGINSEFNVFDYSNRLWL